MAILKKKEWVRAEKKCGLRQDPFFPTTEFFKIGLRLTKDRIIGPTKEMSSKPEKFQPQWEKAYYFSPMPASQIFQA